MEEVQSYYNLADWIKRNLSEKPKALLTPFHLSMFLNTESERLPVKLNQFCEHFELMWQEDDSGSIAFRQKNQEMPVKNKITDSKRKCLPIPSINLNELPKVSFTSRQCGPLKEGYYVAIFSVGLHEIIHVTNANDVPTGWCFGDAHPIRLSEEGYRHIDLRGPINIV